MMQLRAFCMIIIGAATKLHAWLHAWYLHADCTASARTHIGSIYLHLN